MSVNHSKQNPTLFVMAGGFGTRLKPITGLDLPKPMVSVNGHPFLHYQIQSWISQGITSFVFLLHFGAQEIIDFLNSQKRLLLKNCNVNFIVEKSALGTGGAVKNAINLLGINKSFLIANADTWVEGGLEKIIINGPQSIGIVYKNNTDRYGVVEIKDRLVISFKEKLSTQADGWINSGLAYLEPSIFFEINHDEFSLERSVYPLLCNDKKLKSVALSEKFIDIGIPDDYYFFCENLENYIQKDFLIK